MLNELPIINPQDILAMRELMPSLVSDIPGFVATGAEVNAQLLLPQQDWAPMCFQYGWDAEAPAITFGSIGREFYANGGEGKDRLLKMISGAILEHRRRGIETYAVALLQCGWMVSRDMKKDEPSSLHAVRKEIEGFERTGLAEVPGRTEVLSIELIWQDGQRIFLAPIERSATEHPKLGGWRDMSAGSTATKNRFWNGIAPVLAPMAYAEGVMLANGFWNPDGLKENEGEK